MNETITLHAALRRDGSPVYEEVLVQPIADGRFRLIRSPGLVLGLAAGDVFEVGEDRKPRVLARGGNLCIQVYPRGDAVGLERSMLEHLEPLDGRLDGRSSQELVFTVPVSVGFRRLESALNFALAEFPQAEWYYGNVYDPVDGVTPLNWWEC